MLLWLYPRLLVTIKPDSQMHLGELGEGSSSKNALKEAEITKENHHFTSINSMQQQQLLYKAELSGNEEKKCVALDHHLFSTLLIVSSMQIEGKRLNLVFCYKVQKAVAVHSRHQYYLKMSLFKRLYVKYT